MKRDPAVVSFTMSHIKGRDTGIEMKLRKALFEAGYRFRVCSNKVYGHPDIVIAKYKIAIFADSEFWHGYQFEENKDKLETHREYWIPKIERNMERDKEVNEELTRQGYLVLRYWGKEIEKDFDRVFAEITQAIEKRKSLMEKRLKIDEFTTLVYIAKDDCFLMLHRVKKSQDVNEGKWIGVGGHVEKGETPVQCMKREVKEETGLTVKRYRYIGKIDFINDLYHPERMYLYRVDSFEGELVDCDEGELAWIPIERLDELPMWEGDRIFLPLVMKDWPPFTLSLFYHGDQLTEVLGPFYPPLTRKKTLRTRHKRKTPV